MKILGFILKMPLLLLVIGSFGIGVYGAYNELFGIGWGTPISLGILLILYFVGEYLINKKQLKGGPN